MSVKIVNMEISASLYKYREKVKALVTKDHAIQADAQISNGLSINMITSVIESTDITIKRLDCETARLEELEKTMLRYIQGPRSTGGDNGGSQVDGIDSTGGVEEMMIK